MALISFSSIGALCVAAIVIWSCLSTLYARYFRRCSAREQGCQSPKESPFAQGLYLSFKTRRLPLRHEFIPDQALLHSRRDSTFQTTTMGSTTIYTIEPQNIQAIWASCFQDWAVAPIKFRVLGPFCGRGLLTADGERWAISRTTITPSFRNPACINLTLFDTILNEAFDRIPMNGSAVDLQPILFDMVSISANTMSPISCFIDTFCSISGLYTSGAWASPSSRSRVMNRSM